MTAVSDTANLPKSHSLLMRAIIWLHVRRALKQPAWHQDSLQAFAAHLGGQLPEAGEGGVILAACNDLYFERFARSLLCSIEQQGQPQRVHLHLYQPNQTTLDTLHRLQTGFQCARISYTVDDCRLAQQQPYPIMYYASARFLVASLILAQTGSPVLCIDVDTLAHHPVWPAAAPVLTQGDVGLIFRPTAKLPWRRILASAVGLAATPGGQAYCSTVARALLSLLRYRPRYHLDQIVLHYAAELAQQHSTARFYAMPLAFSDYEFHADSTLWTAKGGRKGAEPFQQKQQQVEIDFAALLNPAP